MTVTKQRDAPWIHAFGEDDESFVFHALGEDDEFFVFHVLGADDEVCARAYGEVGARDTCALLRLQRDGYEAA